MKLVFFICLFLLSWSTSVSASASQFGRIIAEVNFREGPSRSTRIIGRLPAGAAVQVLRRDRTGWYSVSYRGRRGFVHHHYLKISQPNKFPHYTFRIGIILLLVGLTLIVHAFAPVLSKTAALLLGSFIAVMVTDLLFRLGVLYSVFSVALGLYGAVLFLTKKEKNRRTTPDENVRILRKAA